MTLCEIINRNEIFNGENKRGVEEVFTLFFKMLSLYLLRGIKKNHRIPQSAQLASTQV
jgi:hypothetical protein